jgi:hypothetical protein
MFLQVCTLLVHIYPVVIIGILYRPNLGSVNAYECSLRGKDGV